MDWAISTWPLDQSYNRLDDTCSVGIKIERTLDASREPDMVNDHDC